MLKCSLLLVCACVSATGGASGPGKEKAENSQSAFEPLGDPIDTIGIYNCYNGVPAAAIPFLKACGYNTYQRWDLGWTRRPSRHAAYYAEIEADVARMKAAGFRVYGLLSVNVRQCAEGDPEGYRDDGFNPRDAALMAERLRYLDRTLQAFAKADGFTIFAGDPGGADDTSFADLSPAVKQIVDLIRQRLPTAEINVNTWGIAAWDKKTSPFLAAYWDKEADFSRRFWDSSALIAPGLGMEFPLHNYYRSLALTCYARENRQPPYYPLAEDVAAYRAQGAKRLWGWPYFLVDEADDGYNNVAAGQSQAEVRYIEAITDRARSLGLNGLIANAFSEKVAPEILNIYAFAQFCRFPEKHPDQVIREFAALLAEPASVDDLAAVLRFIENHSTWEAGLPAAYRLAPLKLTPGTSVEAVKILDGVRLREKPGMDLPESPAAYIQRLRNRLGQIRQSSPGGNGSSPRAPATERVGEAATPIASTLPAAIPAPFPGQPAFKHRGFYIHCGWAFDYPFSPHSWSRADFGNAFELLRRMGFDTVMYWPQIEGIPAPIRDDDAAVLENVRGIIDDARATGLRCWLTLTPNLTSPTEIAAQPFAQRNPFRTYRPARLDLPEQREPFLAHRRAMLRVVNNADAYVTIDGDPGGYPGAKAEDFLRVFEFDRATLDQYGIDPKRQMVIPWLWAGWGRTQPLWQGDLTPFSRAAMMLLKERLPEPWLMLSGRSHDHGVANGRINLALAEELGLIERCVVLCYEAIEFEPTPPAAVLQFNAIRRILKEEARLAPSAAGVMGNAQQPIMVLPNIYFFARASWDPAYLDRDDDAVLRDFAAFLGGPADILLPAWKCLTLPIEDLPKDLPERLRGAQLTSEAARCIPGGPQRYLDILAAQVASRMGLLTAIDGAASDDEDCARRVADGTAALVNWWKMHHYVMDGDRNQGFAWRFVRGDQVALLQAWARHNARDQAAVARAAARWLDAYRVLDEQEAWALITSLFR